MQHSQNRPNQGSSNRYPHHNQRPAGRQGGNPPVGQDSGVATRTPPPLVSKPPQVVDLNTDYGQTRDKELFHTPDESLLAHVSSVNIPCCVHDGDPKEVMQFIAIAKKFECGVGAHIAYPDPENQGNLEMELSAEDLRAWLYVQLGTFQAMAKANGLEVEHVRPHGALYRKFLTDPTVARTVAEVLYDINAWCYLIGPAGTILNNLPNTVGIRVVPEIYLGKAYGRDGTILESQLHQTLAPQTILDQVKQLMSEGTLTTQEGEKVAMPVRSFHISPQLPEAVSLAQKLVAITGKPYPVSYEAVSLSGWV